MDLAGGHRLLAQLEAKVIRVNGQAGRRTFVARAPGKEHQYILRAFSIDSAGTDKDRAVTTADHKDAKGLTTALTDTQLRELATALALYKAPMNTPLKVTTPADPTQVQTSVQK